MITADDLLNAHFDNSDVAFALGQTSFPDWRKNLERQVLMALPRIDEIPTRPKFRIGHVYEYGLFLQLMKFMSRDSASQVVVRLFRNMGKGACDRLNHLDDETRHAILYDGLTSRYLEESSVKAPADNYLFVEYPGIAFDPQFLDRSPERLAAPLLWFVPSAFDTVTAGIPTMDGPTIDVVAVMKRMTEELWRINLDPSVVEPINSVTVVNITATLVEIDRRLTIRLHSRKLRGED